MSIYDAAMRYQSEGMPLVIFAGQEYGTGSSRDWAAKGTRLLGVKAVIAQSFERIHRSNLVGMGVLPCQFKDDTSAASLRLDGSERFDLHGIEDGIEPLEEITLVIHRKSGAVEEVPITLANRHADRGRLLPARRNTSVRVAATACRHDRLLTRSTMSSAELATKTNSPRTYQLFIDGQFVDSESGKTLRTPNPATGETLAEVAEADKADIDKAVAAARRAFEGKWSKMSARDRGRLLYKLSQLIEADAAQLAALETPTTASRSRNRSTSICRT